MTAKETTISLRSRDIIETEKAASLVSCRISGDTVTISVNMPEDCGRVVCGILHYDSPDELRVIEMSTSSGSERPGRVTMSLKDASGQSFIPLRWTALVAVESGGEIRYVPVKCFSRRLKRRLDFRNLHIDMGGGNVLFPYISKAGRLKLSYREASEYDGEKTRIKEYTALLMYKLFGRIYRRRGIFVIFEKFSRTAQDNSFYFFRYCMEELPEEERRRFYYIIDKREPDYQYVKQYGRNVVQFMSIRHMIYAMAARLVISTDTVQHLYAWKSKQNPVKARIMKKPEMFLQHGVTMLKKVDDSFGVTGAYPMKYFVTTSDPEQELAIKYFGYTKETAPVLGFTRWDALRDLSGTSERTVLIMPTWRVWLENADDEEFEGSDYYGHYMSLFSDPRFAELLEENDMQAVLYLHPKFADRMASFGQISGGRIRCVPFGAERLNDLMMRSSILITDYSSVCWDFLYMNKPVLFWQFDYDKYMDQHGSYLDMREDLPGPRAVSEDSLLDALEECIAGGCTLSDVYAVKAERFFRYRDTDNSKRTYGFLMAHEKGGSPRARFFRVSPHQKYWYGYFYEHSPVRTDTILVESFHGKTISDSPLACVQEIQRLWPGKYRIYFATNDIEDHRAAAAALGIDVKLVRIDSMKYTKLLATAGYIISNASLPIFYIRRDGQKYLQTWHGTPLKTLGKKMREGIESMYNVQHNFIQASHILFPNEFTRKAIVEDYKLENLYTGKAVMCGYPRNAVFFDRKAAEKIRERYGLEGKTVYAYMPTWRGTSNRNIDNAEYFEEIGEMFRRLDSCMSDDQLIFVNFHPILKGGTDFDRYKHIRAFPADVSNYEFLNCVDALITDYSSVFFDFSLTGKPIILFMYDREQYMKDRGFYLDPEDLPFRRIYDIDSLCACISEGSCLSDSYADSEYAAKFLAYDSPDCSEKLLEYILNDRDGLKVYDYSYNKDRRISVIRAGKISGPEDLEALAGAAEKNGAVALMYRKWFRNGVGQLLHDKYNDSFDYVITTDDPPRTYLCQIMAKLGSSKAKKHIADNDRKRCFGELDVDPKYSGI